MSVSLIAGLVGGIGLFLLGMHLMTDGLKLAAGGALANMLSRWTGTPLRGLLSGALITAIVQSSSAVTVATIGFVGSLQRSKLPVELDGVLPAALRVSRHYSEVAELATLVAAQRRGQMPLSVEKITSEIGLFTADVSALLVAADVGLAAYTPESCATRLAALEKEYASLKSSLLQAGTREEVPVRRMVEELDTLSNVRRMAQQIERGACHLADMLARLEEPEGAVSHPQAGESVA